MQNYAYLLKKLPLFSGIAESELENLLKCLNSKQDKYLRNDIVVMAGSRITSVGIVLGGTLQIVREDIHGNRNIVAELKQGEMFGETFACAGIAESPVSVIASSDCEVLFIGFGKIITSCSSACIFHTKLIENMLRILANKNIFLNSKIELLSCRTTREKLIKYLENRAKQTGSTTFDIPFSREELADFLCVNRSALSRELGAMSEEGILEYSRNRFVLHL
jgi:CRP-like cAMP-binding protein